MAQVSGRPSPAPSGTSTSNNDLKRRRDANPVVYSQPVDTGTGASLTTQLIYALEYLRQKDKAITFQDLYNYLSPQGYDAQGRRTLEHYVKHHPKIEHDPAGLGGKGSFRFRPKHNVRSTDDLEAFLQRQSTAQGIPVKELKDGWTGAIASITELEKAGKVQVTRNRKDDQPRMVWPNDPSLMHEFDVEFVGLWQKIKSPPNPTELRRELTEFGLTSTSVVKATVAGKTKEKKRKATRRGGKTTNTHMSGVLKDFSHMRRG